MENSVKENRLKLNMTQADLAKKANVTSRTIISIEKGQYNPSLLLAYKLSVILQIEIKDLFDLEKEWKNEK